MFRLLYSLILYLIQPLLVLFMFFRSLKSPQYRQRLNERYGFYGKILPPNPQGILIHAASVGEVIAVTPLIKALLHQYPQHAITVTTMTPTGSERVKTAFGNQVKHIYLPFDLPDAISRFLYFIQPALCIVIETELWANLIHECHQRGIPLLIANARLSPRSAQRYGKLTRYLQPILNKISLIAAQDNLSAKRYQDIGYQGHLQITGNLKYDLTLSEELQQMAKLKRQLSKRPVWIAASTHNGEDEIILKSHRTLLEKYPDLLLILVPRHPERFSDVAEFIEKQGFNYSRRSQQKTAKETDQIFLGDTMGELMYLYALSDIAFVGGSLIPRGGHNPLEPLAFKLPVISGRHTFNFSEIVAQLKSVQGIIEIEENPTALSNAVEVLLNSEEYRIQLGNAGFGVLRENQGALTRLLALLTPYLEK
ncbi:MAG: lipid IV(A) 3-deoxy-D-manno-octulosonic acid transferase [Lonepinella koalarum]|nr:lipid IV(A) 3-deoxy-D-manno-octulosonic acid transferase [Lonepinella koalarum]